MPDATMTYRITAEDLTRGVTSSVNRNMRSIQTSVGQVSAATQSLGRTARGAFSQISNSVHSTGRAASAFASSAVRSFSSAGRAALDLGRQVGTQLHGVFNRLIGVGRTAGVVIGATLAAGFYAVAKTGADMNITLEGSVAALSRMLGSGDAAEKFMKDLRAEARLSLLTFKEMLPTAQGLIAVLGPAGIGQVVPIMRAFGDAATSLRVDAAGLDRAMLGFRQTMSRPFASMEEINQIEENLPGAGVRGILTKAFGTADTEELQRANVTGQQVGMAIVAGLQKSFGGAQAAGQGTIPMLLSGLQDSFNDLSATVTERFTRSIGGSLSFVAKALDALATSPALTGLDVIFTAVGRAMEFVASQAVGVVTWLGKIATAENVSNALVNMLALFQTLGQSLLKLFGIDLVTVFDPKNVVGYFEAIGAGTKAAIDGGFGLIRAYEEARIIISSLFVDLQDWAENSARSGALAWDGMMIALKQGVVDVVTFMAPAINGGFGIVRALGEARVVAQSFFQDLGDWAHDTAQDAGLSFARMMLFIREAVIGANSMMLDSIESITNALNALGRNAEPFVNLWGRMNFKFAWKDVKFQPLDTSGIAKSRQEIKVRSQGLYDENQQLNNTGQNYLAMRRNRDALRMTQDPRRKENIVSRLGDAFSGRTGDMGGQIGFWNSFSEFDVRNRKDAAAMPGRFAAEEWLRMVQESVRMGQDPRRRMSPFQRLGQAFSGEVGDMGPQQAFWKQFEANRAGVRGALIDTPADVWDFSLENGRARGFNRKPPPMGAGVTLPPVAPEQGPGRAVGQVFTTSSGIQYTYPKRGGGGGINYAPTYNLQADQQMIEEILKRTREDLTRMLRQKYAGQGSF